MKRPSAKKASKPERAVLKSGLEKTKKGWFEGKMVWNLQPAETGRSKTQVWLSKSYFAAFGGSRKGSICRRTFTGPNTVQARLWQTQEEVFGVGSDTCPVVFSLDGEGTSVWQKAAVEGSLGVPEFFPGFFVEYWRWEVIDSWQSGDKDKETAMAMPSESDVDKKVVPCSPEVLPAEEQGPPPKKSEKKQRHLKYMRPDQQTEAYANRTRLSLVERKHSGQQLHRMSALQFAQVMVEYGLLEDLTGLPCPFEDCSDKKQQKGYGFGSGSVLGGLSASSVGKSPGSEITLKDCCYRCLRCRRRRVAVTANNVVFPPTARGGYGPTSLGFSA